MIHYINDDKELKSECLIEMANQVWSGAYDVRRMQEAIDRTINITAWHGSKLVGCLRILSDGYLFGTITEVLVLKEYQKRGIGRELMRRAMDLTPTPLFFGAQPEAEGFYEKLGIEKSYSHFISTRNETKIICFCEARLRQPAGGARLLSTQSHV